MGVSGDTRDVTRRPGRMSGDGRRADKEGVQGGSGQLLGVWCQVCPGRQSRKGHWHLHEQALGHKWPSWGKLGNLSGYTEVLSLGKMPMSLGRACPGFAPTLSTPSFAWVSKQYSTFALSWVLCMGWEQEGSEAGPLPHSPPPLPLSAVSRWSQAP